MSWTNNATQNQRRRNVETTYINEDSHYNHQSYQTNNYDSMSNSRTGYASPVPPSLRTCYNRTYILPEMNSSFEYSQVPPQIPSNAPYRYEYCPDIPSKASNSQKKEPTYINPVSEKEYVRVKRNERNAKKTNITSTQYNQSQSSYSDSFFNTFSSTTSASPPPRARTASNYSNKYDSFSSSNTQSSRPKDRVYINPISEKEYEREKRKEKKFERSNNSPAQKKQEQSFFNQFLNFFNNQNSSENIGSNPSSRSFYSSSNKSCRRSPTPEPLRNGNSCGFNFACIIIVVILIFLFSA